MLSADQYSAASPGGLTELMETAREHFREGNYRIAESLLQQVMLKDSNSPEVFNMLATIYYDQGKFNKAIRTFRRALEIDPSFTDSSVGLSIILNDLGRYDEGRQVFTDAQAALAKKSSMSDPQMNEKLATKHDELGQLYFQFKRFDEAAEQYQKALTLSSRKADLNMKLIECFIQAGNNTPAIRELKSLTQEFPNFIPARLKLGTLLYNSKQISEAVQQWETILLRDPEHPIANKYLQMAEQRTIDGTP